MDGDDIRRMFLPETSTHHPDNPLAPFEDDLREDHLTSRHLYEAMFEIQARAYDPPPAVVLSPRMYEAYRAAAECPDPGVVSRETPKSPGPAPTTWHSVYLQDQEFDGFM